MRRRTSLDPNQTGFSRRKVSGGRPAATQRPRRTCLLPRLVSPADGGECRRRPAAVCRGDRVRSLCSHRYSRAARLDRTSSGGRRGGAVAVASRQEPDADVAPASWRGGKHRPPATVQPAGADQQTRREMGALPRDRLLIGSR